MFLILFQVKEVSITNRRVVCNFGVIFDASSNMQRLAFIFLIFLVVGLSARGQDKPITEFDLYGCWILERNEDGKNSTKLIYKRCEDSDSKRAIKNTKISLLAFNESEFETYSAFICFTTVTEKGTWNFDENEGIVSMYCGQEMLKELKEKYPDDYKKLGSPEKFDKMKLKVVELDDGNIGLEKLHKTKPINNAS